MMVEANSVMLLLFEAGKAAAFKSISLIKATNEVYKNSNVHWLARIGRQPAAFHCALNMKHLFLFGGL